MDKCVKCGKSVQRRLDNVQFELGQLLAKLYEKRIEDPEIIHLIEKIHDNVSESQMGLDEK